MRWRFAHSRLPMNNNDHTTLPIVAADPWLEPNALDMERRYRTFRNEYDALCDRYGSLGEYANGALYFGFQYDTILSGWWFRDWLPGAEDVFLFGDFNGWMRTELRLNKD